MGVGQVWTASLAAKGRCESLTQRQPVSSQPSPPSPLALEPLPVPLRAPTLWLRRPTHPLLVHGQVGNGPGQVLGPHLGRGVVPAGVQEWEGERVGGWAGGMPACQTQ